MAKGDDIQERLINFAVRIINLNSSLSNTQAGWFNAQCSMLNCQCSMLNLIIDLVSMPLTAGLFIWKCQESPAVYCRDELAQI